MSVTAVASHTDDLLPVHKEGCQNRTDQQEGMYWVFPVNKKVLLSFNMYSNTQSMK